MSKDGKILMVVDDKNFLVTICDVLLEQGYRNVITVSDGLVGLELARKEKPALIILDVLLPKLDGYHICGLLKYDENYKSIPIILLTGKGRDAEMQLGEKVKADLCLPKPVNSVTLVEKVKFFLKA